MQYGRHKGRKLIKIVHSGDIHLDSPFAMDDLQKSQARKNELRAAFSSLIFWAKTVGADIVLIAGDLFDSRNVPGDCASFVADTFSSFPECRFFISPGNHDFYTPDGVYGKVSFPANVHIFKNSHLEKVTLDIRDRTVNIYGYAFTSPILEKAPFSGFTVPEKDKEDINLLVGHGNLSGDGGDCPIMLRDIEQSGFDYIALGHIHNDPGIKRTGKTHYGYCGSLEPRAFNDRGERGAFLTSVDKDGTTANIKSSFYRLCKRIYAVEEIYVVPQMTSSDIASATLLAIKKAGYGSDTLLRIIYHGYLADSANLPESFDPVFSELYYVEIKDRTCPAFDLDKLSTDPTIKGEVCRLLMDSLRSEDDGEKRLASKALQYALEALSGRDIEI